MLILGLDPGSRQTGYGLVRKSGEKLESVEFGNLRPPARSGPAERLAALSRQLDELLERWQPDAAVLESPFHGLNARSLVVLAQARGALLAVLGRHGLAVREYSPAQIKSAVAGNGRADKEQVARMVALHLAVDTASASADATDALAVAICYAHRQRLEDLASGRGSRRP